MKNFNLYPTLFLAPFVLFLLLLSSSKLNQNLKPPKYLRSYLLMASMVFGQWISAQTFTEQIGTPFDGVSFSSIAFADVDGDNDQDVLITGLNSSNQYISKLYINNGLGGFAEQFGTPFVGVYNGSIAFADVDGDNDQDVLITGENSSNLYISKLYLNDGLGGFTEQLGTPFDGVVYGSIAFADVDGDNDRDVLITGRNGSSQRISKLYINDGTGSFTEQVGTPFEGVESGSIAFADVDGVAGKDVLITGVSSIGQIISKLYLNDGFGNFTIQIVNPLERVLAGSIAFADVDGDNDQDVLVTGQNTSNQDVSKLYLNDGLGNFTEQVGTPFDGVGQSSIDFADVDGDTSQDVLITGWNGSAAISKLYINDGLGSFTEQIGTPFIGVAYCSISFADVDGDNDTDVLITGLNGSVAISKLYLNDTVADSCDCAPELNLVTNGDFEQGNTGFNSDLSPPNPICICGSGSYCVGTNFTAKCGGWPSCVDHTSGTGNFLIVDGFPGSSGNVWSSTVNVVQGTIYSFSFWTANVYPSPPQNFNLNVVIDGTSPISTTTIGTAQVFQQPGNNPKWVQHCFNWPSTFTGPATLKIDQIAGNAYTDFGIDDICFSSVGVVSDSCCTTLEAFCDRLDNNIAITTNPDSCKATLNIGNFPCDGYIEWVNWNGNDPTTQVNGPFPSGSMPMHVYPGSGTYTVCYLAIELDADSLICYEKLVCDTIAIVCDPCCTDSLAFVNAAMNVQTNGTLGDCMIHFDAIGLDSCMQITYEWGENPPSPSVTVGNNTPVWHTYPGPGTYTVCYQIEEVNANDSICWTYEFCEDVLVLCDCCTTLEAFCDRLDNNIAITTNPDSCKATLNIGDLSCDGYIEWVNWNGNDPTTQVNGPFPYGSMPMHVYPGSGTYEICYLAIELDADSLICFEKIVCETIDLDCLNCACLPPTNLVSNGGFENGSPGFPNALDQIGQSFNWYSANNNPSVTGIGDWYSTTSFPGFFNNVPLQEYTVLPAHCGSHYVGVDMNTCEGISTQLVTPIPAGDTYSIDFCWTPSEPVTSNFYFIGIMSGANCTMTKPGGYCGHTCGGDFHVPVQVTTAHIPGTWYTHTATGTAGMTVNYLSFAANLSQTPVDNLIYLDEVCLKNTSLLTPCCTDSLAFFNAAANVQTNGELGNCMIHFNATGLDSCMQITYDWGDCPPVSDGPFGNNTSVWHTYSGPGTYTVCYLIEEVDGDGEVCWVYEVCEEVLVLCDSLCPTDFNLDGKTDGFDFSIFLGNFGLDCLDPCGCPTDLNGDGKTDGFDFSIFLGNYSLNCPAAN